MTSKIKNSIILLERIKEKENETELKVQVLSKGITIKQLLDKVNEILESKELTNEFYEDIIATLFSSEEITDMLLTFALIKLQNDEGVE